MVGVTVLAQAIEHDFQFDSVAGPISTLRLLAHGAPDGELLDRALEIVRTGGSVEHARAKVAAEVSRAVELAERLPRGPAQHALIQLSRFLAIRCGAEAGS